MTRPARIDCVLFDCDGVLVDSEPPGARVNQRVFQSLGVPATYEDCLALAGTSGSSIPPLAARYGVAVTLEDFVEAQRRLVEEGALPPEIYLAPEMRLMPGVRGLLGRLRACGVRCGLVSTTVSSRLLAMANRFGLASAFDVIVAGDMVERHKPDPEPYLAAMRWLGVSAERTVVVEDSPSGVAAGVASGAYVLGFSGSAEVRQDVSAADEPLASFFDFDLL